MCKWFNLDILLLFLSWRFSFKGANLGSELTKRYGHFCYSKSNFSQKKYKLNKNYVEIRRQN